MHSQLATLPIADKQVPAKVTAYVDEGIKELVERLNTFEGIYTYESCIGYNEFTQVWVEGDVIKFAEKLATLLAKEIKQKNLSLDSSEWELDFSIHWNADKGTPYLLVQFPNKRIDDVSNIFSHVRTVFADGKGCRQR